MMILSAKGGWFMQLFGMSVGTAVAVISYVGKIFDPLESIGMEIQNIQAAAAGIHRINEFLEEPEMPLVSDLPAKEERQSVTDIPALQLKNVTFGYEDAQEILHEFSLTVRQGEHVTLSGRTGVCLLYTSRCV